MIFITTKVRSPLSGGGQLFLHLLKERDFTKTTNTNFSFLEDSRQKYLICKLWENGKKYFMKLRTKFLQTRGVDDDYQGSKISRMKEERRVLCRQWCCALSYLERRTWKARKIRELYPIEWTICRCRRALLRTIDFSNLIKSFFQYYSRKEICYRGYWCLYQ